MPRKKYEQIRVGIALFIMCAVLGALAVLAMRDTGTTDDYEPAKRPAQTVDASAGAEPSVTAARPKQSDK